MVNVFGNKKRVTLKAIDDLIFKKRLLIKLDISDSPIYYRSYFNFLGDTKTMSNQVILKENGQIKAKVVDDGYGISFLTMINGLQWTGQPISRELAKLTIDVMKEYLEKTSEIKNKCESL